MNRSFRHACAAIGTLAAACVLAGCTRHDGAAARPPAAAVDVRITRPLAGSAGGALVLPGRVKADQEVALAARIMARLTSIATEGAHFGAGEPLATFDSPEARSGLAAARASLDAAMVRRDRARIQEARLDSLYAGAVVSKADLEAAQVDRQAAESAWSAAQAQLADWTEGTRLTVPFAGVVVRRHADPGQALAPGEPVIDVRSVRALEVLAAVPESQLARLAASPAELQVGDGPWRRAKLTRVEGMTDAATRTRVAHFVAAAGGALEPGAFARVRLLPAAGTTAASTTSNAPASRLAVPATAIVRRGALAGVYVVEDGRARLRWLRLGAIDGDRAEVLAGLWPTDDVALDPAPLADGAPVRVVR